jgi:lipoprotein-anchoring transpeptidase ErfK/SrfK
MLKKSLFTKIFLIGFLPSLALAGAVLLLSARSFKEEIDCGCGVIENSLTGRFDPQAKTAYFEGRETVAPQAVIPSRDSLLESLGAVLGTTTDERWIEVDLSDQRVYAHEGEKTVYNFLVSTGKWGRTPTGNFRVWLKLKYTKMSGGSKEKRTYYYLPNVPYVMYFHKGYGFHGTYWHQNFGQPMSHGCINMATPDAEKLFYWASPVLPEGQKIVRANKNNPGIKVVIHE